MIPRRNIVKKYGFDLYRLGDLSSSKATFFSVVPGDVVDQVYKYCTVDPNSITTLLLHVIYAMSENINAIEAILEANPRLLLKKGDVKNLANKHIKNVTPYECALGAGDAEMANIIGKYFAKLDPILRGAGKGEIERQRQYSKYKKYIYKKSYIDICWYTYVSTMLDQSPDYHFQSIVDKIIKAPYIHAWHILEERGAYREYPLYKTISKFRKHFMEKAISKGMHFNYMNLIEAIKVYQSNFFALLDAGHGYSYKADLFLVKVIGLMQLNLPSCDLQAFGEGLNGITFREKRMIRSAMVDDLRDGLGDRWAYDVDGNRMSRRLKYPETLSLYSVKKYYQSKAIALKEARYLK